MTMRRWALGLAAGVMCGTAVAAPPALSEGREVDPVVRDFQLATPPALEGAAPSRSAEQSGDPFVASMLAVLCDMLLNRLTMPLGTVPMAGSR